jgi:hypothetical protein
VGVNATQIGKQAVDHFVWVLCFVPEVGGGVVDYPEPSPGHRVTPDNRAVPINLPYARRISKGTDQIRL